MDEAGSRTNLKKSGKQAHVIDGLVLQVQRFAGYLTEERGQTLESASVPSLPQEVRSRFASTRALPPLVEY